MDDNKYRTIIIKPILWKLYVIAFFSAPVLFIIALFIQLLIWPDIEFQIDIMVIILLISIFAGSLLLKVFIHPVALFIFSKIYTSEISLGFNKRFMAFYLKNIVKLSVYRNSLLLTILVNVLPLIIGIATNTLFLTAFGSVLTAAGIGELIIIRSLRKVPGDALLYEYPDKFGCEVYIRKDI